MTCEIPVDYNLKISGATFSSNFGIEFLQTFVDCEPKLQAQSVLACAPTYIKRKTNKIHIDWACLGINWKPDNTYRLVFGSDVLRDFNDVKKQPNSEFEVNFTSNPLPTVLIADPVFSDNDVTNNTKIEFIFDRKMRKGQTGNLYLYQEDGATDILLKTFNIATDVTLTTDAGDISKFTLSDTGLLQANKTFYITSDVKVFRDWDNMYYPQLAVGDYTFTTDLSVNEFPDLISFVTSSGTLEFTYIRYRDTASNFDLVDTTLTAPYIRYRDTASNFDQVTANQTASLVYANATTTTNISSAFEFVDIFITYTAGGQGIFTSTADIASVVGVIKEFLSAVSADSTLLANTLTSVTREFNFTNSSSFDNSFTGDHSLLENTRSADTYATNTTTTISGGPRLTDTKGPATDLYTLTITPSDTGAVTLLDVDWYNDSNFSSVTEKCTAISGDGNTMAITDGNDDVVIYKRAGGNWASQATIAGDSGTYGFGYSMDLSYDGNTIAISKPDTTGSFPSYTSPTVKVYTRSGSTWSLQQTITGPNFTIFGYSVSLSGDGTTLAIGQTRQDSTAGAVHVYTRSGSTWSLQDNTTFVYTGTVDADEITNGGGTGSYAQVVRLSSNGNLLVVSAPYECQTTANVRTGAVYTYTRSGTTWTEQTKLYRTVTGSDRSVLQFGQDLDLSKDGNSLVVVQGFVGDIGNPSSPDAKSLIHVQIYSWGGTSWSLHTNFNPGSNENGFFGFWPNSNNGVAINSDGTRIVFNSQISTGEESAWSTANPVQYGRLRVLEKISGTWYLNDTFTFVDYDTSAEGLDLGEVIDISDDGLVITATDNTTVRLFNDEKSWNNSTKTLTLTGSKTIITAKIDLIRYIPATSYTSNFVLTYTGSRASDSRSSTLTQNINHV